MTEINDEKLIRVTKGILCAGIVIKHGRCVEAAPVLAWCVTKPEVWLREYFSRRGYYTTTIASHRSVHQ